MTRPGAIEHDLRIPHNEEAEQTILATLLINNAYWRQASGLRAEHFFDPANQKIFAAIKQMIEAGRLANPITLRDRFLADGDFEGVGGPAYLARLATFLGAPLTLPDYAHVVMDLHSRREMMVIAEDLLRQAADTSDGGTGAQVAARTLARLVDVNTGASGDMMRDAGEVFDEVLAQMVGGGERKWRTGLWRLDKAMGGGLHAGRFYGIRARFKAGKTTLLSTISYNLLMAEEPCPHLFISLEGMAGSIIQTMAARFAGVNAEDIRNGTLDAAATQRVIDARPYFQGRGLSFVRRPRMTLTDLKTVLARYAMAKKGHGVMLDYLQLISGKPAKQSTAEFLDEVAQTLAEFCANHGMWCIAPAQENREGQLRGGDGMLNACDQAYALGRVECADNEPDQAWLEMIASRYNRGYHVGTPDNPQLLAHKDVGPYFTDKPEDYI